MFEKKKKMGSKEDDVGVNTGGGAYVDGSVNTGGGDFVGRDKKVFGGEGGLVVGGSIRNSTVATGTGSVIGSVQNLFVPVYCAIKQSALSAQAKADLAIDVKEIEDEIVKANKADETFLARHLRNLKRMAPDIGELLLSALVGPGAVVNTLVKKVAEKVKSEA